jgi:hypothetical protein
MDRHVALRTTGPRHHPRLFKCSLPLWAAADWCNSEAKTASAGNQRAHEVSKNCHAADKACAWRYLFEWLSPKKKLSKNKTTPCSKEGVSCGLSLNASARTGHPAALALCLSQHRHLFTSTSLALAFSLHNKQLFFKENLRA